jgi:hypothetical protein
MAAPLVVIDDRYVASVATLPAEADAVLIIDADAGLPLAVTRELLQVVARRDTEVIEGLGRIQEQQIPQRRTLEWATVPAHRLASEESLRRIIAETTDHARYRNATR